MKVKVLYFANARDIAERGDEVVNMEDGSSVEDLGETLLRLHPGLRRLWGSTRFSVNLELAEVGAGLHEGDEVGVLPPVAGG